MWKENKSLFLSIGAVILLIVGLFFLKGQGTIPGGFRPPAGSNSQSPSPVSSNVTISNFSFSPSTVTIKVGQKITWTNKDNVSHSATADDGSFDTQTIAPGETREITFTKPGTYTYHCTLHPNMKATIEVRQ